LPVREARTIPATFSRFLECCTNFMYSINSNLKKKTWSECNRVIVIHEECHSSYGLTGFYTMYCNVPVWTFRSNMLPHFQGEEFGWMWNHSNLHCLPTIQYTTTNLTLLHFTSLYFNLLHFTSLYFTSLYLSSLHFTSLHFTLLYLSSLHFILLQFTSLYFTYCRKWHQTDSVLEQLSSVHVHRTTSTCFNYYCSHLHTLQVYNNRYT
jgi:hypothetical protein